MALQGAGLREFLPVPIEDCHAAALPGGDGKMPPVWVKAHRISRTRGHFPCLDLLAGMHVPDVKHSVLCGAEPIALAAESGSAGRCGSALGIAPQPPVRT